jgi:hypothetical protein
MCEDIILGEKSLVLSPGLLTQDQEQVLKSCLTPPKVYNRGTPSMGSILTIIHVMSATGNRLYAKFLLQIHATPKEIIMYCSIRPFAYLASSSHHA